MRTKIFLPTVQDYKKYQAVFLSCKSEIAKILPKLRIVHVGSTSVRGVVTKGDLDINVLCSSSQFKNASKCLLKNYSVAQEGNWTSSFASFKTKYDGVDIGIQLSTKGGPQDVFIAFRRKLADPKTKHEYNKVKLKNCGKSMQEYRLAKAKAIEAFLR